MATHTVGGVVYAYTYDDVGNILTISENNVLRYSYTYDKLGQLNTVIYYSDNYYTSEYYDVYEYLYDKSGNITFANHHYGVGTAYTDTISYTYGNATWGDLLTAYNGTNITYDAIGNPVKWRNAASFVWYGRQLLQFQGLEGSVTAYGYNADGIRTSKTFYDVDSNVTGTVKYTLDGGTIVAENRNGANIYYTYDDKGAIMGMLYDEDNYIFSKNLQGDIIGIYNANRQLVAKYQYSAFGEITAITDGSGNDVSSNASHIANINPFRYRGYYYDTDTGFYYLQTRYYDPVVGRFLNADAYVSTGQGIVGNNMFGYCGNNPVNGSDPCGTCFHHWKFWKDCAKCAAKKAEKKAQEEAQTIKYAVPLYEQGSLSLCWAFCQTMMESYNSGTTLTQKEAKARAIEIAQDYHGSTNKKIWNQGGWPANLGKCVGSVDSIEELYNILQDNGPVYAYYSDNKSAHIVIVTGVNLYRGIVYTNNPWGVRGKQSFEKFQKGFATKWYQFGKGKMKSGAIIYLMTKEDT